MYIHSLIFKTSVTPINTNLTFFKIPVSNVSIHVEAITETNLPSFICADKIRN